MLKKILAISLAVFLLASVLSVPVFAVPYADIKIAAGAQSAIKAVEFDSVDDDWKDGSCGGGKSIRPDERIDTEPGAGAAEDFDGNIGWTDHGTWVQWTVNVEADGDYRFEAWCASDNGSNEGLSLLYDDALIGSIDYVEQEGWQEYTLYKFGDIKMTAGTHVIKAQWGSVGGFNIAAIIVTPLINGQPMWIPVELKINASGKNVIRAVDFDAGADKYSVAASGNHDIRPNEAVNTEPGGSEFGGNIGWITAGDWVQYSVKVQRDGAYKFDAWLASDADPQGGVTVYVDGKEIGTSPNSSKDGWQTYALYPVGEGNITAGDHVIKVEFTGGCNFAALEVTRTGDIKDESAAAPEAAAPGDGAEAPAPEANDDNAGADATAAANANDSTSTTDDGSGNMILWIGIAAGAVIVIVVIVVLVTKKKK